MKKAWVQGTPCGSW